MEPEPEKVCDDCTDVEWDCKSETESDVDVESDTERPEFEMESDVEVEVDLDVEVESDVDVRELEVEAIPSATGSEQSARLGLVGDIINLISSNQYSTSLGPF